METETSLIGSDSVVELDTVSGVGLNLTIVVDPGHPEGEDAVRFYDSLDNLSGLDKSSILKCKNMFTLGMACYIYHRPLEYIYEYIESKFSKKHPEMIAPNRKVVTDGFNYASNLQIEADTYHVAPADLPKGTYRNINGNQALAWGFIAASHKAGLPLFCGSYPITPATGILEELSIHKNLGVKTMQTEDEIAGICSAIGAAFAGNLAVTTTSGPGLSQSAELADLPPQQLVLRLLHP